MALIPPQPVGIPPGHSYWNDWIEKLRTVVNQLLTSINWSIITGTPTTLSGYGITDPVELTTRKNAANGYAGLDAFSLIDPDQLGSGVRDGTKFLRDDGTWQAGGGGGVTDHGALTGLGDDDHTQYHTDARGDLRYSRLGHNHTGVYEPLIVKGTGIITVPYPGRFEWEETISATGATTSSKVFLSLAAHDDSDENHEAGLNILSMGGRGDTDAITVAVSFGENTAGPIKLNYMVV